MNEPARSDSLDARAWWTLAVVVAVVLIAFLGLSAGRRSSHETLQDEAPTEASQSTDPSKTSTSGMQRPKTADGPSGNATSDPALDDESDGETRSEPPGSEPLDAQSLRDFGELGVLPGLFDDITSVPDCDFDDALSTCQ